MEGAFQDPMMTMSLESFLKESKVWDDEVETDENLLYEDMEDFGDMPISFPTDAGLSQNILSPNPISPGSTSSSDNNSYFVQPSINIKANGQLNSFSQFNSTSGETDLRDVKVEIELQEYLFNRLQWYYVTCRFTDNDGKAILSGHPIVFDPKITFVDGRRRNPAADASGGKKVPLHFTIHGNCATTGRPLRKCKRCREKDRALTKRKRKRDESSIWSDADEENNSKIIQVLSTGDEIIDDEGEVKFRLRIGCCVGVNKQHHMNHLGSDDETGKEKLDIHKNCDGLALAVEVATPDHRNVITMTAKENIRVLGKVTDTDRERYKTAHSEVVNAQPVNSVVNNTLAPIVPANKKIKLEPVHRQEEAITNDIEELPDEAKRRDVGCSACSAKCDTELFSVISPCKLKPSVILNHFASNYRTVFDSMFPTPMRSLYTTEFFNRPFSEFTDPQSPAMLQVYTVLGVGACVAGYMDAAEKFWDTAIALGDTLLQSKVTSKKDIILLADGLNRISFYFGSGGDATKARFYNAHAHHLLENLVQNGHNDILDMPVYETAVWSRLTYNLDIATLRAGFEWAKQRGRRDVQIYSLFLWIMTLCTPELHKFNEKPASGSSNQQQIIADQLREHLLGLFRDMKSLVEEARYKQVYDGNRSYRKLVEEGLLAMEFWLIGNKEDAAAHASRATIQASLFDSPKFPALVPIYFAAYVNLQMTAVDVDKYADQAELCIRAFSRICNFRWARILADFLTSALEQTTGTMMDISYCPLRKDKLPPPLK